jgi:hypothetical protein
VQAGDIESSDRRPGEIAKQIDEVAGFADDPAAAEPWVLDPAVDGHGAGRPALPKSTTADKYVAAQAGVEPPYDDDPANLRQLKSEHRRVLGPRAHETSGPIGWAEPAQPITSRHP